MFDPALTDFSKNWESLTLDLDVIARVVSYKVPEGPFDRSGRSSVFDKAMRDPGTE